MDKSWCEYYIIKSKWVKWDQSSLIFFIIDFKKSIDEIQFAIRWLSRENTIYIVLHLNSMTASLKPHLPLLRVVVKVGITCRDKEPTLRNTIYDNPGAHRFGIVGPIIGSNLFVDPYELCVI